MSATRTTTHRRLTALLTLATLALLTLTAPQVARSEDRISSPEELTRLCRLAPPLPRSATPGKAARAASLSDDKLREHLIDRQRRLLTLYAVDVEAQHFKVADYDESKRLLTLVSQPHYALFDGHYAVTLHDEPLLAYEVEPGVAETITTAHATGRAVVRLYIVLDALHDPAASYCSTSTPAATLTLRGRLVGSRIWHMDCAGEPTAALTSTSILAEQRHVDAPVLEQLVGEDMRGRALPRPQVRIDRPKALDGVIEPKHLKTLSRDAELLLLPCFLKAMGQLGSQRAALVLEAHFDAEGNPRDAAVAVDAAGSRALDGCATERLEMLRVGPLPRPGSVRLNAYFDRR